MAKADAKLEGMRPAVDGLRLHLVTDLRKAQELAVELAKFDVIALDFETNSKPVRSKDFNAVGISFSRDRFEGWYIPFGHEAPKQESLFAKPLVQLDRDTVFDLFRFVWETKKLVGHNLKYETQVFQHYDEDVVFWKESLKGGGNYFDTYVAQRVMDNRVRDTRLKSLMRKYFKRWALTLNNVLGKNNRDFTRCPLDLALAYAGPDSPNSYALYDMFRTLLEQDSAFTRGSSHVFFDYDMPTVDVVANMETVGMKLDEKHIERIYDATTIECDKYLKKMRGLVLKTCPDFTEQYGEFTPTVKDTVIAALFDVFKLPKARETYDKPSTERAELEKTRDIIDKSARNAKKYKDGRQFLQALLDWGQPHKIRSTYTRNLLEKRVDGILYPEFDHVGANSGRGISKNPNGQNLPKDDPWDVRGAFLPPYADWVWVRADYRAMEMCATAGLSGCPVLKPMITGEVTIFDLERLGNVRVADAVKHYEQRVQEMVEDDHMEEEKARDMARLVDMHRYTGAVTFKVAYDEVTGKQRKQAKPVNFGILYGITKFGLAAQLGVKPAVAQAFIDGYFEAYPGVAEWIKANNREVYLRKMVATEQGRFRLVPQDLWGESASRYEAVRRWATNHKVQGYCGYVVKEAMRRVDRLIRKHKLRARQGFQIHDELIAASPREEADRVGNILVSSMYTKINGVALESDGYQIRRTLGKAA